MDKLSKEQRHRCMAAIKGKNTKPELLVRKFLFSRGFRYRLNHPRLPGHPDIVLRKYKTVIFVNGCFWHGHEGCKYFVWPKSNKEFWENKIKTNIGRDNKKINHSDISSFNLFSRNVRRERGNDGARRWRRNA